MTRVPGKRRAGTPLPSSADAERRMKAQKTRDTDAELRLRSALHALGLRFRVHRPVIGTRRKADLVFSSARVAVFFDGCFWHGCPEHATWPKANAEFWRRKIEANRTRDAGTDHLLETAGWLSVRIWEHEEPATAAARVAQAVIARSVGKVPATTPSHGRDPSGQLSVTTPEMPAAGPSRSGMPSATRKSRQ